MSSRAFHAIANREKSWLFIKVIRYEYDQVGNLSKMTYPDNTFVVYTYDENHNLLTLTMRLAAEAFYVEGSRMERKDINNASFVYSVSLLRLLLELQLISEEEYKKVVRISAAHYNVENICLK